MKLFYKKYKEILLYLFFGGVAFVISIVSYAVCNVTFGLNELIANIISWILAVIFAFVTNRTWVFQVTGDNMGCIWKQIITFLEGRVVTFLIEELILLIFITWLGFNSILIKVIAQVVVIVLNYVISKFLVFKR